MHLSLGLSIKALSINYFLLSISVILNLFFVIGDGDGYGGGEKRYNSFRLQESLPKTLTVEVLSSQSKVSVSVDGTTVSLLFYL